VGELHLHTLHHHLPAITARMTTIQGRTGQLASAFHLVSFSVDPDYGHAERLAAYARAHQRQSADVELPHRPEQAVKDTVVSGLKIAMEKEKREDGGVEGVLTTAATSFSSTGRAGFAATTTRRRATWWTRWFGTPPCS